jgi:hypothetical protein
MKSGDRLRAKIDPSREGTQIRLLEALIAEQKRTNQLLEWLGSLIQPPAS